MAEQVTDEVVETAAKARWDHSRSGDLTEWEMRHPAFREHDTETMRAALEAVAPAIAAKALDDAADELVMGHKPDGVSTWQWLRDRAKLTAPTEPREDHAATDPLDDPAVRLLRDIFVGDSLDESDHRPRHNRHGGHVYRHGPNHWHDYGLEDGRCDMEPAGDDPVRLSDFPGPLTFCDCDAAATIEATD